MAVKNASAPKNTHHADRNVIRIAPLPDYYSHIAKLLYHLPYLIAILRTYSKKDR